MADVAVVGGGLVGRLLSWRLARAGVSVALYERGDASGQASAAWVAAAMLAPLSESAVAEPLLVNLGAAALERWPHWLAELPEPVFFQQNGTLIVWHTADQADEALFARRVRANAPAALRENGFVALDAAGLAQAEPVLAGRFRRSWLLPNEGQLDNRQLLSALHAALASQGVPLHTGEAIDEGNWPRAAVTVDCRGLGAKPAWPDLRGIRGEVIRVKAPGIGLSRPVRLLHPRYPLYIAPKERDHYVIGATEIEGEDQSPLSVRSALELLSAAFSVHPGFGEARILELNTQCRPTLADHRPAITLRTGPPMQAGARPGDSAFRMAINGLYRHGFMIAPEVVSEAVALTMACLDGQFSGDAVHGNGRPGPADTNAVLARWREKSRWPGLYPHA